MENITQGQWFRGPSADLGDTIEQSLRFRSDANTNLSRTPSSSGNRQTWTYSFWFKLGKFGSSSTFLSVNAAANNSSFSELVLESTRFTFQANTISYFIQERHLRDPSAWYHIVLICDTTNATAGDRIRFYVNGQRETSFAAQTNPGQNDNLAINLADPTVIGLRAGTTTNTIEGQLAQVYFIDGTAIGDTGGVIDEFGRYNEDGVWVPQDYTGSYGTNGYKLVFDSSAGLGDDTSGNGNDFTATGFDTATISSSNFDNDIDYEDTPTNNHPTLNPLTKSDTGSLTAGTPVWADGNLNFRAHNSDDTGTHRVRTTTATMGVTSGKWYFEVTRPHITSGVTPNNSWIVGWATSAPPHTSPSAGSGWTDIENYAVFDGFNGNTKANGATVQSPSSTPSEATDQILAYAFDFDATSNNVKLYHNNTLINTMSLDIGDSVMLPCVWSGYGSENAFNFGQRPFVYTPPSGHIGLAGNELPEPTIKNGKEHFEAVTFTGNATQRNITGLEFQPDLVFAKNTATSGHWNWHDSVRGPTKRLTSNSSAAETTYSDYLNAFNSDGFSVGTEGAINGNGNTIVAYCFKGGGTASSNSDGSLTSSVSANTDAGFSIVSYTGDNSSSQTIGHGLNSAPEMMIVKNRIDDLHWIVYHKDMSSDPKNRYLKLDENEASAAAGNSAAGMWANTNPTNSVFSVGTGYGNTNGNSDSMIAYCWHSVESFSKVGFWTGNGSDDGPWIHCGFKPQFLLFKMAGGGSYWQIRDATRDPDNPVGNEIYPATTESQNTHSSTRYIDFLANGFKIRTNGGAVNTDGSTFIFLALAEHPFGGENQPPATAR